MAQRLKCGAVIAVFFWCIPASSAQPGVQIVTQEDIARSGVIRLTDLFALAGAWETTSTDGFHWDAAPIGLGLSEAWRLFVDESPVDVRAVGRHRLNLLPVNVAQICRVELHSGPAVIGGTAALSGAVHIRTCNPKRGWTVHGSAAAANETGDPGPWRYTPLAGPNVDRSGPTLQASLARSSSRAHIRIQAGMDEHHATDPRIRARVHTLYRGEKDARIQLQNARMDVRWMQHRLVLTSSRSSDFLYSILFGLEAPVDHEITSLRFQGSRRSVRYSLKSARNRISTRANPKNLDVDLNHIATSGQLLMTPIRGRPSLSVGLRGTLTSARFQPGVPTRAFFQGRAFGRWTPRLAASVESILYGAIRIDGSIPGFTAMATATLNEPQLNLKIALSHRAHAAQMDFPYWLRQGYRPTKSIDFAVNRSHATQLSADVGWRATSDRMDFTVTGGLRHHDSMQILNARARFDTVTTSLATHGQVSYVSGQIGRIAARLRAQLSGRIRTMLHATLALPLSVQSDYSSFWKHRLQLHAMANYVPNPRLSLQLRLRLRGSSQWPLYEEPARDGPAHYADYLSPGLFADFTVQKRLWHDHLCLTAALRNLIDHEYLHHPAGGRTRLSIHIRIAWSIEAPEQN